MVARCKALERLTAREGEKQTMWLIWVVLLLLVLALLYMSGLSARLETLEEQVADCVTVEDRDHMEEAREKFRSV